jgi:glycosyltransferase involved in cell wall biosynthesis
MRRRPRLLFLCQTLPYPPDGGVWIRTYHVLRLLARTFDVTALCFERATAAAVPPDAHGQSSGDALSRFANVEVFPLPQRHSRVRYIWDHLRSVMLRRVYTEFVYESRSFQRRLTELLRNTRFDIVHADSLSDLVRYLPICQGIPIVCVHHNVESELLRRRAGVEASRLRRAYLRYQARLLGQVERTWCPRIALNVAVSTADRDALSRIAPGSRVVVVPNGVDVDEFRPAAAKGAGVAFVGGASWFPNRDALEFFTDRILPFLRATKPDVSIRWIGSASVEQQKRYREQYRVELTGYMHDARPPMLEAACHIVPLRVGGGTRLKILNAWAMGKPVVSTSVGCEGLAADDGENILIRDDPESFAEAIVSVLDDQELAGRLGDRGRATVERSYSWDVIGEEMIGTYLALAGFDRGNGASASVSPETQPQSVSRLHLLQDGDDVGPEGRKPLVHQYSQPDELEHRQWKHAGEHRRGNDGVMLENPE